MKTPSTALRNPRRARLGRAGILALLAVLALALGAPLRAHAEPEAASEEIGRGAPTIVLIHSLGGDRGDWSQVVPRLAASHRVILVDLPGHGASPMLAKPPTVENVADAVEHALSARKVKGAVVVGHSYGALVALQVALDHGKRAGAVVAVDAATYMDADSTRIQEIDRLLRERYSVFLEGVFGPMSREPLRGDTLITHARRVKQDVLSAYFRDVWKEDFRPRIAPLQTPIHVIATEALWPPAESWTSARKRLGYMTAGPAVGARVPGSGHVIMMDQPAALADQIEAIAAGMAKKR